MSVAIAGSEDEKRKCQDEKSEQRNQRERRKHEARRGERWLEEERGEDA
jgi:hypothetical protein